MASGKTFSRIFWIALFSFSLLLSGCSYLPWGGKDETEDDLAFENDFGSEYDSEFDENPKESSGKSKRASQSREDDFFADESLDQPDEPASSGDEDVFGDESSSGDGFASIDQATDKEEMKADIETLQSQQEALITRVRELQEIVQSMEPRLTATQDRLETSLGVATTESQGLGPEIETMKLEIERLNGEIEKLQSKGTRKMSQASTGRKTRKAAKSTSKTPPGYNKALDAYRAGNFDESILLFQELSLGSPPESLKDNIVFWIGSNYLKLEMYDDAISQFQTVLDQYPGGNKVHDSRYLMGVCYQKKGDTGRALDVLEAALKGNPPTEVRKKVELQLMEIK